MTLKDMTPWRWGGLRRMDEEERPYGSFRRDMESLQKEMDRLFEDFWKGGAGPGWMGRSSEFGEVMPRVDETEDEQAFHIRVELPGMDKDDVDLTLSDGFLTIKGEKKREEEEKGKDYYRKEREFGSFRRSLPIPAEVDESKIDASFKKGVLNIELPKTEEARKKIKRISVKAA
ncbi:MAG: Hsp20/alpha crystallin family protein [Xanthomonadales bacterium]|nr:Hsp20/alpha crystallin family protein [Xanthomonadales bacterium]